MSNVKNVNDSTFESEVLKSTQPVLVEFGAEWCGPCHRMSPILDQISDNKDIKVFKIDIDDATEVTAKYGIRGVPTIMLFNNGKVLASKVGLIPFNALDSFITENLNK